MAGIFISYRREDSQGYAGRINGDLKRELDARQIFRDIDRSSATSTRFRPGSISTRRSSTRSGNATRCSR